MARGENASGYSTSKILTAKQGVLSIGAGRAIVTSEAAYVFLMKVLHEHAPHALKYAFYDMGYRVGEDLAAALPQGNPAPEEGFRSLVETYMRSGYGHLEVSQVDFQIPEARLVGTNLFETEVARHSGIYRTPRCVDHYSRGLFAGFMSKLLGREVVCEEISCEYRGDERCEFVVLPFNGRSASAAAGNATGRA